MKDQTNAICNRFGIREAISLWHGVQLHSGVREAEASKTCNVFMQVWEDVLEVLSITGKIQPIIYIGA